MALPDIMPESQVNIFNFYENHAIYEAVLHKNRFMKLAGVFLAVDKQGAIDFAYQLCENYPTLLTPGSSQYRVWVDMHCPQEFDIKTVLPLPD
ncbi:MAG: hypothetical protein AAGH67_08505 [Cyanobacteria bacterium P01_H01_bin.162]